MNANTIVLLMIGVSVIISSVGALLYRIKKCKACDCFTCEQDLEAAQPQPMRAESQIPIAAKAIWGKK